MKTKFTKGKWSVAERSMPRGFTLVVTDKGDNICRLNKKNELANAKLIAAAPTLFKALRKIAESNFDGLQVTKEDVLGFIKIAQEAIKKATE